MLKFEMKFHYILFFIIFTNTTLVGQSKTGYLTKDGAWCWFSDPRGIMLEDNLITGWVKSDGTIEAAVFNTNTTRIELNELYYKLEKDDHNNPSFTTTSSNEVIAMYTRHSKKDLFINRIKIDKKKLASQKRK